MLPELQVYPVRRCQGNQAGPANINGRAGDVNGLVYPRERVELEGIGGYIHALDRPDPATYTHGQGSGSKSDAAKGKRGNQCHDNRHI